RQSLPGLPAIERIAVVGRKEGEFRVAVTVVDDHRRREAAQQRGNRSFTDADETKCLRSLGQFDHGGAARAAFDTSFKVERQVTAVAPDERERERNRHRLLARRRGCRWNRLRQRQLVSPAYGVVQAAGGDARGPGLRIPAAKLREVALVGIADRS